MSEISLLKLQNAAALTIDKKEIERYLKMYKSEAVLDNLISESIKEVQKVATLNAVFLKTSVLLKNGEIILDFDTVKSENLSKNLCSCKEAYVFCATLGIEVDRLIKKYSKIEPSRAMVIDSVASALIESFCDYINEFLSENKDLCPRFSCGYGDFDICHQEAILSALDAAKKIGVSLNSSYMMAPSKTVTAIIGIK